MALADCNAAEMLGALMLGLGKTGRVRASATTATSSSARSRDSYQYYAVALYRQALLTLDDPALAGHVVG